MTLFLVETPSHPRPPFYLILRRPELDPRQQPTDCPCGQDMVSGDLSTKRVYSFHSRASEIANSVTVECFQFSQEIEVA